MGVLARPLVVRLGLALLLFPTLASGNVSPAAAAVRGPCGEIASLPGPGHYSGGFKGTLVRTFRTPLGSQELAAPVGGLLEIDIDEGGRVTGNATSQQEPGGTVSLSFNLALDGQLPEPVDDADVPAAGQGSLSWQGLIGAGGAADIPLTVHFRGFERNLCAAVQGNWDLEDIDGDSAGSWQLRDAQWAAKLVDFNGDVERQVRGAVLALVQLPPDQALGLPAALGLDEANALLDALGSGATPEPSGGLFGLYQQVLASGAPAAQIRCLTDLVHSATALKLQEYLAAGAQPVYEEAARYGYSIAVAQEIGSGPNCAALAGGLAGLTQIIAAALQQAMAEEQLDPVVRLTREAGRFGLTELFNQGRDWLAQRGLGV